MKSYEKNTESLALLKILTLSSKSLKEGKTKVLTQSFKDVRKRINERLAP